MDDNKEVNIQDIMYEAFDMMNGDVPMDFERFYEIEQLLLNEREKLSTDYDEMVNTLWLIMDGLARGGPTRMHNMLVPLEDSIALYEDLESMKKTMETNQINGGVIDRFLRKIRTYRVNNSTGHLFWTRLV